MDPRLLPLLSLRDAMPQALAFGELHQEGDYADSTLLSSHRADEAAVRQVEVLLERVNDALPAELSQQLHIESSAEDALEARDIARRLAWSRLVEVRFGVDFVIECRHRLSLVDDQRFARVFFALASIAGSRESLERENHGFGYQFHYVASRKKPIRYDVLFTFSRDEPIGPPDALYWERHGSLCPGDAVDMVASQMPSSSLRGTTIVAKAGEGGVPTTGSERIGFVLRVTDSDGRPPLWHF